VAGRGFADCAGDFRIRGAARGQRPGDRGLVSHQRSTVAPAVILAKARGADQPDGQRRAGDGRGLLERYGGALQAANRPASEGPGAVFTVALPVDGQPVGLSAQVDRTRSGWL
jgi:hypothetical protein